MTTIQSAITIIKNDGSCHPAIKCSECPLYKPLCADVMAIPKDKKATLAVQWLIPILGEKETKERLTEELL